MSSFLNLTITPRIAEYIEVRRESGRLGYEAHERTLEWDDSVEVVLNTTQAAMMLSDLSTLLADALQEGDE